MSKRPRATQDIKPQEEPKFLKNDKEYKMLNDLQSKGTLYDKISAIIRKIEITYRPEKFCDFNSLGILLDMAKKKSRHHSEAAVDGLKELFIEKLRKPRKPAENEENEKENGKGKQKKKEEAKGKDVVHEKIIEKYREFIEILKQSSTVEHYHKHMIRTMSELVIMKEEMRDKLIEEIVNKLGDPNNAIPTCVVLECNNIVRRRRFLLVPVLKAITQFVFRKNQSANAKFYSIVLINSIKLKPGEQEAVKIIIQTLLKLFTTLVKEARQQGNKAIALLLKTLNKTFPLHSAKGSVYQDFFKAEIDELYSLTHHQENINIQIESLRFVFQMELTQGAISDRYYRALYEHILPHPRLRSINYKSLTLLFNTIMMSLKEDFNLTRVKAFLKRLMQCCLIADSPFILGTLLLVYEVMKIHPGTQTMVQEAIVQDEEEKYEDVPDSDEEEKVVEEEKIEEETNEKPSLSGYDPIKREPKYSGAEYANFYELKQLTKNLHPTISKWAQKILNNEPIEYEGDPLLDFSLINFLDRFAYRNPKTSIISKLKGKKVRMSLVEETVNSKNFKLKGENEVREEEKFFHKYFNMKKDEPIEEEDMDEDMDGENDSDVMDFGDLDMGDEADFGEEEAIEDGSAGRKKMKRSVFADADEYNDR